MAYTYYIPTLILTVIGLVFWMYPPKKINEFYGYRTTRSRKSQEAWDFAQRYSAKLMTILGLAALIVAASAHLFRNGERLDMEEGIGKTDSKLTWMSA